MPDCYVESWWYVGWERFVLSAAVSSHGYFFASGWTLVSTGFVALTARSCLSWVCLVWLALSSLVPLRPARPLESRGFALPPSRRPLPPSRGVVRATSRLMLSSMKFELSKYCLTCSTDVRNESLRSELNKVKYLVHSNKLRNKCLN